MNCPEEVAEALLQIIHRAVLYIRVAGWQHDAAYCALEADHIHNLPGLILNYSRDNLKYYLDIERPGSIERVKEVSGNAEAFQAQWQRLEQFVKAELE